MNNPISRIASKWDRLPRGKQILIEGAVYFVWFATILEEAVMGGKSRLPGVALALVSVAYVLLALIFFRTYPEIVLTAGYILGAVHISIFLISLLNRGRDDKDDQ